MATPYQDAIEETIRQIAYGADPFPLAAGVAANLKNYFKPDFEKAINTPGGQPNPWDAGDRYYVLPLARHVGEFAAILKRVEAATRGAAPTGAIEQMQVDMAMWAVGKTMCPPGKYCMSYPPPSYKTEADNLKKALLEAASVSAT